MNISISVSDHVSAAFVQNAIPIVHEIKIENDDEEAVRDLSVEVRAEPPFIAPCVVALDAIPAGGLHHIVAPKLQLDAQFLRTLTEGCAATLHVTVTAGGVELTSHSEPVRLLPPSHWGGVGSSPELLTAFVRPNDPAVDAILHDAATKLAAAGRNGAIDGYVSGGRERAWELAGAIWSALAARALVYVVAPASFERSGQKVRAPGEIIERRTGNCLDLTLLYAACLEQAGLRPILVVVEGHAFVGLWLVKDALPSAVVDDPQMLRKRRDLDDMILVETTLLTSRPPVRFAGAVERGARQIEADAPAPFELAIDVARARSEQIRPFDLGDQAHSLVRPQEPEASVDLGLDDAPVFIGDIAPVEPETDAPVDRLERWKRRLLDLTLRNKMLNFKDAKKSIAIECPDPARLEDLLAAGERFKLLPRSDVLGAGDRRDAALFQEINQSDGRRAHAIEAIERRELLSAVGDKELEARLTEMFRITRTAFEEGGSNILFLAFGFLVWTQRDGGPALRAPLLLIPAALERSSVRSGFRLKLHEDETRFNPTLIELLRQDFDLKMPEFDRELPSDGSGVDVARVWQIVRTHVRDLKGWEVTPDVVLATFSFTKFLMWKDLVDRTEMLKRNPVVRHLLDTPKESYGDGTGFPEPETLDRDHHPSELFAPLSADSSQLAAVIAASNGKDFVLHGPPGAGKSQTIANMISQCLAVGKTVLFVSQKTAALEVVQRRLKDIGLGDFCLEVHSTKAQKSAVLGQLSAAWRERAKTTEGDWAAATTELAALRDELNGLVHALHRPRPSGLTAHQALGATVAARGRFEDVAFAPTAGEPTVETRAMARRLCREMSIALGELGDPAAHPLRDLEAEEWSPDWSRRFAAALDRMVAALAPVENAAAGLATSVGAPKPLGPEGFEALSSFIGVLVDPAAERGRVLLGGRPAGFDRVVRELGDLQARAKDLRAGLAARWRDAVFGEDLHTRLTEWREASAAMFVTRGARQRKVRQALEPFATSALPEELGPEIAGLIELQEVRRAAEGPAEALGAFATVGRGLDADLAALGTATAWADGARRTIAAAAPAVGLDAATLIAHAETLLSGYAHLFEPQGDATEQLRRFEPVWSKARDAVAEAMALAGRASAPVAADGVGWSADLSALAERWRRGLPEANRWINWVSVAARARRSGLGSLVQSVTLGSTTPREIGAAFDAAFARWQSEKLVDEEPILRRFLAARHEDAIARFRTADAQVCELSKRIVRARLGSGVPHPTAFGSDPEWGALSREISKKARHMPLRRLFAAIPTVLPRLTPCAMMSPLSIAQYLPAHSPPFDVVIFDEASQIPAWDAVGAMARGLQVVIVGDPEQLPPTNVGDRGIDEVLDGADVEDQESILDECLASNVPSRRLDWHYRSRHESLIVFSNKAYYKGRLITFPSPITDDRAVRYVNVPDGVYERGSGRVNREEARVLVADVVRRLREPAFRRDKRSLGVVTFNGEQQRLIENLLDAERRARPEIEPFFDDAQWHEPVFVKNLENVQGDEREIILFSVAVAPDAAGRPVTTISSLNKDGGYRRLNVAITRARSEMVVFATLRPDMIDLSRTKSRGVRDFKHFLEFAERGVRAIAEQFAPTGAETESPFEDAVKGALERLGWSIHAQVGASGFRIDLGVVHPDAPGRYLAGVECDGATYHRSATARDRDRLREQVLTGLGWRIRRVWSADWWSDAGRALDKLDAALRQDLEQDRRATEDAAREAAEQAERDAVAKEAVAHEASAQEAGVDAQDGSWPQTAPAEEPPLADDPQPPPAPATIETAPAPVASAPGAALYRVARLEDAGFTPDPETFYDVEARGRIRAFVGHIIAVEGPIFDDLLVQRIARAHGFSRAAGRIREIVIGAVPAHLPRAHEGDRVVFWPSGADPSAPVAFRHAANTVRDHSDVPLVELSSLASEAIADGADDEEAIRRIALRFELGRLRSAARARFEAAVKLARGDGADALGREDTRATDEPYASD